MKISKLSFLLFNMFFILLLAGSPLLAQAKAPEQVTPDDIVPTPNYPNMDDVLTQKPTFYFSEVGSAVLYSMRVYDVNSGVLLYRFKGDGDCEFSICSFKPDTLLKVYDISGKRGEYYWQIRAKVGDSWSAYSDPAPFRVLEDEFYSTFNVNMNKWRIVAGAWTIKTPVYLRGVGKVDHDASVVQKQLFKPGMGYTVMMKRKIESNTPNRVYFLGYPYTNEGEVRDDGWDDGYIFEYTNDGNWGLRKRVDGVQTTLLPETGSWEFSEFIHPYGWNELSIWAVDSSIHLWINGEYLDKYVLPEPLSEGYVGIGVYEGDSLKSPLLVDYAKLEYSGDDPIPDP